MGVNIQSPALSVVTVVPICVPSAYKVTVLPVGVLEEATPVITGRLLALVVAVVLPSIVPTVGALGGGVGGVTVSPPGSAPA